VWEGVFFVSGRNGAKRQVYFGGGDHGIPEVVTFQCVSVVQQVFCRRAASFSPCKGRKGETILGGQVGAYIGSDGWMDHAFWEGDANDTENR